MKTLEQCTTLDDMKEWLAKRDYTPRVEYLDALYHANQLGWNEAIEAAAKVASAFDSRVVAYHVRALKRPTQEKGE